ncbi:MAG: prephenate dehydrogenase [Spirochaetaceae bacterium]|jgi:prephenate dehydrogenase|nr:prephenate dehydrogenase [Spirochaetaceae bacterium]
MRNKTYGVVGLGLIGGSFALALRENAIAAPSRILALDVNKAALEQAEESGAIGKGYSPGSEAQMLSLCDLVFICLYPGQTIDFLKSQKDNFKKGSIVVDVSGVKTALEENRRSFSPHPRFDFISVHPMAGGEKEGFLHAKASVFKGRNCLLIPSPENKPQNIAFIKDLMRQTGFARVIETSAAVHDGKIAFTSQLCHVIAAALVDGAEDERITEFGGGSFEDLTRIAMINAPLWTELFLSNKTYLVKSIETFEKSLSSIKKMLVEDQREALVKKLSGVREKRIAMSRSIYPESRSSV